MARVSRWGNVPRARSPREGKQVTRDTRYRRWGSQMKGLCIVQSAASPAVGRARASGGNDLLSAVSAPDPRKLPRGSPRTGAVWAGDTSGGGVSLVVPVAAVAPSRGTALRCGGRPRLAGSTAQPGGRGGQHAEPTMEQIRQALWRARLLHVDETGGHLMGKVRWIH